MTSVVQWHSTMLTHPGKIRKYNEDNCLILDHPVLWAVADGMGGHEAGDVASQRIMQALQTVTSSNNLSEFVHEIETTLIEVNHNLKILAQEKYNNRTIGSTVVTMISNNVSIAYLWAGDSRLYRIRDQKITQLTTDHSEVQNLVDRGLLLPEEAKNHPASNVITRAIGATSHIELSIGMEEIEHDDVYLLCSDGLYADVDDDELLALCSQQDDIQKTAEKIMTLALSREARDNITFVLAKCQMAD